MSHTPGSSSSQSLSPPYRQPPKCHRPPSVCVCPFPLNVCSLVELLVPIYFYFRFIPFTCQDIYWDFFLFMEVFAIHFSLYPTLFLKTPKACVMTQGSPISLLALVCPGKSLLYKRKPHHPGFLTLFHLWRNVQNFRGARYLI